MPSQAQIGKQIRTVEDLRDVIGSMRALAAIYLRRAEERLDGLRAYADTVGRAIAECLFGRVIRPPEGPSRRRDLVGALRQIPLDLALLPEPRHRRPLRLRHRRLDDVRRLSGAAEAWTAREC